VTGARVWVCWCRGAATYVLLASCVSVSRLNMQQRPQLRPVPLLSRACRFLSSNNSVCTSLDLQMEVQ